MGVRKFVNGDIEVDFYHEDQITEYRYSSDPERLGNFPDELIQTMASTLAKNICIEIYFDDDDNPTHLELEECDDEPDEDEFEDEEFENEDEEDDNEPDNRNYA